MNKSIRVFAASFALLSLVAAGAYSEQAPAKPPPAVDPGAVKLLRGMTDYLSGLKQFSVVALNMREYVLESGQRVDFEVSSKVINSANSAIALLESQTPRQKSV